LDYLHTEPVQALADISRSALCCYSNETRAQIANPSNSAQLGPIGHPLPFLKLYPGPCSSVGMRRWTDTQTDRHTDGHGRYKFRPGCASREM